MPAYINGSVPVEQSGIANGMNAVLRTVGGAIGTSVMGAVLTAGMLHPGAGIAVPTVGAYEHGFLIAALMALVAAGVPFLVKAPRGAAASVGTQGSAAPGGVEKEVVGAAV